MGRPRKTEKRKTIQDRRDPMQTLTPGDIFYIEQHGEMSIEEIARNLEKPVELIQSFTTEWFAKHPPAKAMPRTRKLLARSKGTVGMTEAASMAGDDSKFNPKGKLAEIHQALSEGREADAARLRAEYDDNLEVRRTEKMKHKYADKIHFIQPPDDPTKVY